MTSSAERSIRPGTLRITAESNEPLGKRKDNMTSQVAYCLSQLAGQINMFAELTKLAMTKVVIFAKRGKLGQKNLSV